MKDVKWRIDTMRMPDGLAIRMDDDYWLSLETWDEAAMFMEKVERLYRHPELILVKEKEE